LDGRGVQSPVTRASSRRGWRVGASPLSIAHAPFVPWMIRGNGDRGEPMEALR
jgi:hypothetical protein